MAVGIPGAAPFGGHAGQVRCVAYSPDGTAFVTGGQDGVVRLWDAASRTQIRQFAGHAGPVRAVAWGPGGTSIASGGNDTTVRLWDVPSGELTWQLTGHGHPVRDVAWSPDGTAIASAAASARLWDVATGRQERHFTAHNHAVRAVAWSPDGNAIASAAGSIRIWEPETGQQIARFTGHDHAVRSLAWHPSGAFLASGAGSLRLWDLATGTQVQQFSDFKGRARSLAWNPHGTFIAIGSGGIDTGGSIDASGLVQLWEPDHGVARRLDELASPVTAVAWSADGSVLAVAGEFDCALRLWEVTAEETPARVIGHTGGVQRVAWSADGLLIATAGAVDGAIRVWDAATGEQVREFRGQDMAWRPDSAIIAIAEFDGTVQLWELSAGGTTQGARYRGTPAGVQDLAWNPEGRIMAIALGNRIVLWDPVAGQRVRELSNAADVNAVAWNPDGTVIAAADLEGTVRLWDVASAVQMRQFRGADRGTSAVAWAPDGTSVATMDFADGVRLWDPVTGRRIRQLTAHADPVGDVYYPYGYAFACSPDGASIATAGHDGTIRLWDPVTGQQVRRLIGHVGPVTDVAWNPDGSTVASVGLDGTIRIWNPRSGTQVNGSGFGGVRMPDRPLAGVRSDSPSGIDLLGVGEDVAMLAELIAATETKPPLAIALIGDWGAGKSSVMLQMEQRVRELADRARNNPGLTAWAETVRQVRFNAWHYSDEKLWAGLVSHLFDVLAAPPGEAEDQSVADPGSVTAQRRRLGNERNRKRRARDELEGKLKAADAIARPAGFTWLVSPWYAARVLLAVAWQGFRDLRASLLTLAGWIALGAGAFAAWHYVRGWIAAITTVAALVLPPVTTALGRTRAFVDRQRASLAARQQEYERDIKSIEDQLVLVDAAERLSRFLTGRGEGGGYRDQQGLLGRVRADLDQLAADLGAARRQWERDGRAGPPPLERIVLYIDDLDRCPPHRVVEVLEAVHLMLALDLFVVVVAVDARWLVRSLEYHHHELFKDGGNGENAATPIDYLDKIFQIPFTLLPSAPEATADFLRSMLPQSAPAPPAPAPARQGISTSDGASSLPSAAAIAPAAAARDDGAELPADEDLADDVTLPAGTGPAAGPVAGAMVELRPLGLQVSQAEVEFMTRLGELLPTPRAAKRLVNLYRLVRIGIRSGDLAEFVGDETGGPFQAVQVLLALLVGHPEFAREVFRVILDGAEGGEGAHADLASVVEEAGGRDGQPHSFWTVRALLGKIREEAPAAVSMAECRRWCPRLARFSFYTRELAGGARRD